jgi:hypothetical protein
VFEEEGAQDLEVGRGLKEERVGEGGRGDAGVLLGLEERVRPDMVGEGGKGRMRQDETSRRFYLMQGTSLV